MLSAEGLPATSGLGKRHRLGFTKGLTVQLPYPLIHDALARRRRLNKT